MMLVSKLFVRQFSSSNCERGWLPNLSNFNFAMKKPTILLIIAVTTSGMILLAGLVTSDNTKYHNDFDRFFPPHAADISATLIVSSNRFNLAGIVDDDIYVYDRKGVLKMSLRLKDTLRINLEMDIGSEVLIQRPYFFIHNGSRRQISRGDIDDWVVDTTFSAVPNFTAFQPINSNKVALRTMNIRERKNMLVNNTDTQKFILKKQVDGLICTDGLLQYSKELNQIVYVYRYRNQYVCFDTLFNVIRYGKTIDTTSVAKIEVAEVDGKITMAKPPLFVNNDAYVDGKYLFVHSNLVARNEVLSRAKNRSVVDVYNFLDGSYNYSFYIENYGDSRMQGFAVNKTVFIAIFRTAIVQYEMPLKYLP
jgi:hypothetical protein